MGLGSDTTACGTPPAGLTSSEVYHALETTCPPRIVTPTTAESMALSASAKGTLSTQRSPGCPALRLRGVAGASAVPKNSDSAAHGVRRSSVPSSLPPAVVRVLAARMATHGSAGPNGASVPAATATPAACSDAQR